VNLFGCRPNIYKCDVFIHFQLNTIRIDRQFLNVSAQLSCISVSVHEVIYRQIKYHDGSSISLLTLAEV
jgi:hypothetical protein